MLMVGGGEERQEDSEQERAFEKEFEGGGGSENEWPVNWAAEGLGDGENKDDGCDDDESEVDCNGNTCDDDGD